MYPLSFIIWVPLISLAAVLILPTRLQKTFRHIALATTLSQALALGWIFLQGIANTPVEQLAWLRLDLGQMGELSVDYLVGIDGLNAGFVLLAVFVLTMGVIASWHMQQHTRAYFALYLLMNTLLMGSFLSLNLLLFYMFFEAALLPIYFFIGVWGGKRRQQAAMQFLLYTLLGAIIILAVILVLSRSVYDPVATGMQMGILAPGEQPTAAQLEIVQGIVQGYSVTPQALVYTLDLRHMADARNFLPDAALGLMQGTLIGGQPARLLAFMALLIGFLIKLAAVPFHTWLPDAHVEAPTPISMVLAAVMLKLGGYGLLRTAYQIFPEGAIYYSWPIGLLGIIAIFYAALNALAMQDLKKMVAYASIAHMGFVLLGLASVTTEGILGALYQMISHGLITTLLFGVVGVLQARTQDRCIAHYQGLATHMPYYATITIITFFAAAGLPGFSGFVAEILILWGAVQSPFLPKWMAMAGACGIFMNASYWVWTVQRMFWGRPGFHQAAHGAMLTDLRAQEYIFFVPLLVLILMLGVYPQGLLGFLKDHIGDWAAQLHVVGQANLALILP